MRNKVTYGLKSTAFQRHTNVAKLIIDNLTMAQAKTLAEWYEGQGEQDANVWFDISGVPTPYVDVHKGTNVNKVEETVTIFCK